MLLADKVGLMFHTIAVPADVDAVVPPGNGCALLVDKRVCGTSNISGRCWTVVLSSSGGNSVQPPRFAPAGHPGDLSPIAYHSATTAEPR